MTVVRVRSTLQNSSEIVRISEGGTMMSTTRATECSISHDIGLSLAYTIMRTAFGSNHWIREGKSLNLTNVEPVPDVCVVSGTPRSYLAKPRMALIIIEVADSSLSYDLGDKANLYASANIADYWVLDLNRRRLIIHRDPQNDVYTSITTHNEMETVSPLAAPNASILVSDLLP